MPETAARSIGLLYSTELQRVAVKWMALVGSVFWLITQTDVPKQMFLKHWVTNNEYIISI